MSESPTPGAVGTQVAALEAKKSAGACAPKRAHKEMETGTNGNASSSSTHQNPDAVICLNDGDDDEDDKDAKRVVEEMERAIKNEIHNSTGSKPEDKPIQSDDENL